MLITINLHLNLFAFVFHLWYFTIRMEHKSTSQKHVVSFIFILWNKYLIEIAKHFILVSSLILYWKTFMQKYCHFNRWNTIWFFSLFSQLFLSFIFVDCVLAHGSGFYRWNKHFRRIIYICLIRLFVFLFIFVCKNILEITAIE